MGGVDAVQAQCIRGAAAALVERGDKASTILETGQLLQVGHDGLLSLAIWIRPGDRPDRDGCRINLDGVTMLSPPDAEYQQN
jgi:hypothetical protein